MNNAIGLVKTDMKRHAVSVVLPGEQEERSLFLIMISAQTSKLKDFEQTYGNKVTTTHLKVARKVFGEVETENVYGVLMDENLQMVFAFNRDFADYDAKRKAVIFKDVDDILLDRIEAKREDAPTPIPNRRDFAFPRRPGGSGVIKYSLSEKQEAS